MNNHCLSVFSLLCKFTSLVRRHKSDLFAQKWMYW